VRCGGEEPRDLLLTTDEQHLHADLLDRLQRAGDDLARRAVAPHRVNGDRAAAHATFSGLPSRAQATSMACRPLYQPQFGHTTCGCFTVWQFGHTERAGGSSRRFADRREWVFARGVLRLGTAIVVARFSG
jgi:hypothetical protein